MVDELATGASVFRAAKFEKSAAAGRDFPSRSGPEIAFAGRSNSGKSSALNALADHRGLARVSKTPGRTQLINFFRVGDGYWVDLPGYGYARVPEAMRAQWRPLIERYLAGRDVLCGLILVMDARHPLTSLDEQLAGWLGAEGKPVHALLTKADKLSRSQAARTLRQVEHELALRCAGASVQLFSSVTKLGIGEARDRIAGWMQKNRPPVKGEEDRGPNCLNKD
ncbi:MAG TPA: YihA family ribosome biogenesis GTP-binding protein [Rhodocyclaceae bacterium]|nr:MAG: YihA family ribosome biogenesis GTP-binding protein [Betaproteobacteria bacterium CG2_30_68_42]PIV71402.1 MAG: YihA family ribosome biogenesis GTP-binding protein [Rhodocyclales bacterium CG17_big_fil_post_rev_8_21_14_2_50_68_7]PIX75352.1 MAG: YihA family ribosome biogenesis GTP-binding protein [Rhodocyclales bacterium CG_4_10_14_3_um_filter_68_10]PJA56345.1 MAG: YihA family ribosome biogenesis GTP-binding protein [Rhodocyclales bacterium CG_4_9_14_3_um_filter_68_10]HCX34613.1 YihA fami